MKVKIPEKLPFDYRVLLLIPIIIFLLSVGILVNQYMQTGEWFQRSIELKGGTLITMSISEPVDVGWIENSLLETFKKVQVREIRSLEGQGLVVQVPADVKPENVISKLKSIGIKVSDYSVETIGPSLGKSFWYQAQIAIIIAFVLMGIIVFIIFRTFVPSIAVIMSALSDMINTLAFMQLFGIELSLAGLAALLMLIGYSVDTDIMLTTRLLKEYESKTLNEKLKGALKTGLTMTFTTIAALAALLMSAISPVLTQIATVLFMGLVFDIINTWLMNSVVLKWYCIKKGLI